MRRGVCSSDRCEMSTLVSVMMGLGRTCETQKRNGVCTMATAYGASGRRRLFGGWAVCGAPREEVVGHNIWGPEARSIDGEKKGTRRNKNVIVGFELCGL